MHAQASVPLADLCRGQKTREWIGKSSVVSSIAYTRVATSQYRDRVILNAHIPECFWLENMHRGEALAYLRNGSNIVRMGAEQ